MPQANTKSNNIHRAKVLCCPLILGAVLEGTASCLGYLIGCASHNVSPVGQDALYAFEAGAAMSWLSLPLMICMIACAKDLYKQADRSETGRCCPLIVALLCYGFAFLAVWVLTGAAGMAMIGQQELMHPVGADAGFWGGVISMAVLTACCVSGAGELIATKFFSSGNRSAESQPFISNGATVRANDAALRVNDEVHVNLSQEPVAAGYQAVSYQNQ